MVFGAEMRDRCRLFFQHALCDDPCAVSFVAVSIWCLALVSCFPSWCLVTSVPPLTFSGYQGGTAWVSFRNKHWQCWDTGLASWSSVVWGLHPLQVFGEWVYPSAGAAGQGEPGCMFGTAQDCCCPCRKFRGYLIFKNGPSTRWVLIVRKTKEYLFQAQVSPLFPLFPSYLLLYHPAPILQALALLTFSLHSLTISLETHCF